MHNGTDGCLDCKCTSIGDGVINVNEFDGEDTAADHIARLTFDQLGFHIVAVFRELVAQDTECQTGTVDRDVNIAQDVRKRTDVVFMSVRNENTADFVLILFQIRDIGNDEVDAGHFIIREAHAAVDDDDIVFIFQNGDILTDLFQTAEGNNF